MFCHGCLQEHISKSEEEGLGQEEQLKCPCCGSVAEQQPIALENPSQSVERVGPASVNYHNGESYQEDQQYQQNQRDRLNPCPLLEDQEDSRYPQRPSPRRVRIKERKLGDDEHYFQPKCKETTNWLMENDKEWPAESVNPSAKTTAVKNQILKWQKEAPNDKIIGKCVPLRGQRRHGDRTRVS